jgi:hypothetical protein
VLHIAHALWGGLFLFVAALLPLALANRWAIQASAVLSGIGIGLFIDEVGKLITQANDYFFPPALAIIYGFILLCIFGYVTFRRPRERDPRKAMYHVFEGLKDVLDGDLDAAEASRMEAQVAIAEQSDRDQIAFLANAVGRFLHQEKEHLPAAEPGTWRRVARRVDALGQRVGRRAHRNIIVVLLIVWVMFAIGFIALLLAGGTSLDSQIARWRAALVAIQGTVGGLMIVALGFWLAGHDQRGLRFAILGFVVSLVAFQLLYFYLSQFSAIASTLLQLAILQILFGYRRWYLGDSRADTVADAG